MSVYGMSQCCDVAGVIDRALLYCSITFAHPEHIRVREYTCRALQANQTATHFFCTLRQHPQSFTMAQLKVQARDMHYMILPVLPMV